MLPEAKFDPSFRSQWLAQFDTTTKELIEMGHRKQGIAWALGLLLAAVLLGEILGGCSVNPVVGEGGGKPALPPPAPATAVCSFSGSTESVSCWCGDRVINGSTQHADCAVQVVITPGGTCSAATTKQIDVFGSGAIFMRWKITTNGYSFDGTSNFSATEVSRDNGWTPSVFLALNRRSTASGTPISYTLGTSAKCTFDPVIINRG